MDAFVPTRAAGLAHLHRVLPRLGLAYAAGRNFARPDSTARLSPWLRHRMLGEPEVIAAALDAHGPQAAERFVQEVFWRTYWKGWLELRPGVWAGYRAEVCADLNAVASQEGLRARHKAACLGQTGIACFDHWARALADTGFLHNHERMWFASIWIFTLRLPWALGADLFLRQLLDGDAASNTLSWRWVAGLHTRGKHYVATAQNIARFTEGRFDPAGQLDERPAPLEGPPPPDPRPLPEPTPPMPGLRTGLLLHDEDLTLAGLGGLANVAVATLNASARRSSLAVAPRVVAFAEGALADGVSRLAHGPATTCAEAEGLANWAQKHDLAQIALPHAPTGPARDVLDDLARVAPKLRLVLLRQDWDSACWPHATAGFFRFRKQIPALIASQIRR